MNQAKYHDCIHSIPRDFFDITTGTESTIMTNTASKVIKGTKTFGDTTPAEPVTVVAATPDAGHKVPAARKVTKKKTFGPAGQVNLCLLNEREGAFHFITASTVPHDAHVTAAPAGWGKIEGDAVDGADAAVTYLKGIGADASRALLAKLFPKKLTVKKPRTVTARVSRATITDEDLLTFIKGNNLVDARIQVILDSVRAKGFSASQPRVDKLLGRVTA